MSKRRSIFAALVATALIVLMALPIASATAAEPWWQVLNGSRPTNLWLPKAEKEEQKLTTELFAGAVFAARVEVGGQVVGCLGKGEFFFLKATELCETETGFGPAETAEQLEELLEAPYGAGEVEVTGGPVGSAPFIVRSEWGVLPVSLKPIVFEGFLPVGTAKTEFVSEGSGRLVLTLTNLGDETADGASSPVTIVDKLPQGVLAYGVEAAAPRYGIQANEAEIPVQCVVETTAEVVCTYEGTVTPYEGIEIEVLTVLAGNPPAAGAPGEVTVSGGNAPSARTSQTVNVSDQPVEFGIEQFSAVAEEEGGKPSAPGLGGAPDTRAGSHPFQLTTTLQLNAGAVHPTVPGVLSRPGARWLTVDQPALPRNVRVPLPAGLVGNATVMPQCDMATFLHMKQAINECPDATAVGVSSVSIIERFGFGLLRVAVPVFNLPPAQGEPARFGFMVATDPVIIDTFVDPADGYRIGARVSNVSQLVQFLSATTTLWGTPGDPRHDNARGWDCVYYEPLGSSCVRPSNLSETAFLRMPVQCSSPLHSGLEIEPWNVPLGSEVDSTSFEEAPLNGCNQVPFDPSIHSSPTTKLAENPSGLSFDLNMRNSGLNNSEGIAEGQPKKVEVTLPEGMTINPSEGEGLVGCSEAEYARETASSRPGEGCPDASKVGTIEISTPLLEEEAHGALYVAAPYDNPTNSLIGLYMVARIPDRGIVVKQAGSVAPDPDTGQLTTTFDDLPQLPFSSFKLRFREGGRAPLTTPPACGTYQVIARFTPWSAQDPDSPAPGEVVERTSPFTVERGVDGGACPSGGLPPFHPQLLAGTTNNAAGSFSPFTVRLSRNDGEQEFTNFSIKLPPGIAGKLAGIPLCSNAQIAQAISRTGPHGGREELDDQSCPAVSQVGRTLAGAGVGSILTYAPGKIYLAGPYHGAPISFVSITSGVVGPFDIGTVVVRLALRVNPETGEVFLDSTGSDPIPHIVKGIVLHVRDIRAYVDRPEFTFNPTSCEPTSTAATVLGSGLNFASPTDDNPFVSTSPFQAADCAALRFKPKLTFRAKGSHRRGGNPSLRAHVAMKGFGEAAIRYAQVTLPQSEFLDQAHIGTVCTRVQFKAGAGNGAECPAASIYGHVRASTPILEGPLEGPIFLRSSEHQLPDLVAALHHQEINIDLVGRIDSVNAGGIRNTFEFVPDAPVTSADFTFFGKGKGLLENSTNLCAGKHLVKVLLKGHNGKQAVYRTPLKASCGKRH
jgi:hypothetical protein